MATIKLPWPLGTPGAIRTRDLPLRRRMLYPAELRAHINDCIVPKKSLCVNRKKTHFLPLRAYTVSSIAERSEAMETESTPIDLDDLLFEEDCWYPSSR